MIRRIRITWVTVAAGLMVPMSASAQRSGELTFYSQIGFRGQSYTVTGPDIRACLVLFLIFRPCSGRAAWTRSL